MTDITNPELFYATKRAVIVYEQEIFMQMGKILVRRTGPNAFMVRGPGPTPTQNQLLHAVYQFLIIEQRNGEAPQ